MKEAKVSRKAYQEKKIRGTGTKPSERKKWHGWVGEKDGQGEGSGIKKGRVQVIVCCDDGITRRNRKTDTAGIFSGNASWVMYHAKWNLDPTLSTKYSRDRGRKRKPQTKNVCFLKPG